MSKPIKAYCTGPLSNGSEIFKVQVFSESGCIDEVPSTLFCTGEQEARDLADWINLFDERKQILSTHGGEPCQTTNPT